MPDISLKKTCTCFCLQCCVSCEILLYDEEDESQEEEEDGVCPAGRLTAGLFLI